MVGNIVFAAGKCQFEFIMKKLSCPPDLRKHIQQIVVPYGDAREELHALLDGFAEVSSQAKVVIISNTVLPRNRRPFIEHIKQSASPGKDIYIFLVLEKSLSTEPALAEAGVQDTVCLEDLAGFISGLLYGHRIFT